MEWKLITIDRFNGRVHGIVTITVAVFLLSFSDALVKFAGERFGLAQLVVLRSVVAGALVATGIAIAAGPTALRTKRPVWVWARSLSLTAMWLTYYAALPSMSLALAAAFYYTSPIWMALMARFALGTHIGGRGWSAIGLSMIGVFLVVNPTTETLSPFVLLPLAAAFFYALAGTITWSHCKGETAGAMALNLNICLCVVAAIWLVVLVIIRPMEQENFILTIWPDLRWLDWCLVVFLGCLLAIVATMVALAYRLAPTPIVGVFDTAYLGFAAFWSVILFSDLPTPTEALGIGLIATGAILMTYRSSPE